MKIGSIVMFTDPKKHSDHPGYYPPLRTLGIVIAAYDSTDMIRVQWPSGSTSLDDIWWCGYECVVDLSKGENHVRH